MREKHFMVIWSKVPPSDLTKTPRQANVMELAYPESVTHAIRCLPWAQVLERGPEGYRTLGFFINGRRVSGSSVTSQGIDLLALEDTEGNA